MAVYELRVRRREDELRVAEELMADLEALVEAGLVTAAPDPAGVVRYAPAGPEGDEAA